MQALGVVAIFLGVTMGCYWIYSTNQYLIGFLLLMGATGAMASENKEFGISFGISLVAFATSSFIGSLMYSFIAEYWKGILLTLGSIALLRYGGYIYANIRVSMLEREKSNLTVQGIKDNNNNSTGKTILKVFGFIFTLLFSYAIYVTFFKEEKELELMKLKGFTSPSGLEMVEIPSGQFKMGCSEGDELCADDEKPSQQINISKAFYIGKNEVTVGEWKKVMGNSIEYNENCGDNCAVTGISWNDVQKYIQKLCITERLYPCKYRLPTEAEWEYAYRAGTTSVYYWGENTIGNYAWLVDNSDDKIGYVGLKKPNQYGLYDMAGNAGEWLNDFYSDDHSKLEAKDPKGAKTGENRVVKGGSYLSSEELLRASQRFSLDPKEKFLDIGFRLVRDL